MINRRYRKLLGPHAGRAFTVAAPYGEIEVPMRWMLHMEGDDKEKLIISEIDLTDRSKWLPID